MPVLSKLTMLADIPIEVYRETGLEVIEELAPAPLNIFVVVYYKSDKVVSSKSFCVQSCVVSSTLL